jgi:hypothetical protein
VLARKHSRYPIRASFLVSRTTFGAARLRSIQDPLEEVKQSKGNEKRNPEDLSRHEGIH